MPLKYHNIMEFAKASVRRFYFFHLVLRSHDNNMHVEGLPPTNLCLVTLLRSEQCLQFERSYLQHIQMVNKTSSFKQN